MTKPSSLSTCAMVTFTFVEGMSTAGDSMRFALRMRVNMSAIESVIILASLLNGFRLAFARRPASAKRKRQKYYQLAFCTPGIKPLFAMSRKQIRQMPNLRYTARARPHSRQRMRILTSSRGAIFFLPDLCSSSFFRLRACSTLLAVVDIAHNPFNPLANRLRFPERHAEQFQELARFVVGARAGDEGDVHALREVHLVGVDLGEDHLLGQADRVVPVAVEALRIDAAKVANTGQGDADEPIEELVHAPAAQSHAGADLVALPQAKRADGDARLGDLAALAGDARQVLGGLLHAVLVLQRLADAHVDDDLLQLRQTQDVLPPELLLKRRDDFLRVFLLQTGH